MRMSGWRRSLKTARAWWGSRSIFRLQAASRTAASAGCVCVPSRPQALPAGAGGHPGGGDGRPGAGEPVYQHHPEPAGGRHRGGHPGVSGALKVYVCNVMTQEGETEGYTAADHIRALFNHSCPETLRLMPGQRLPHPTFGDRRGYTREGAEPHPVRPGCLRGAGGGGHQLAPCPRWKTGWYAIIQGHLAWELMRLHAQRNIRLVEAFPPPDAEKPSGEDEEGYAVICGKGEKRAVPDAGAAPVLRTGGGLRRAALRQHLQSHGGAASLPRAPSLPPGCPGCSSGPSV